MWLCSSSTSIIEDRGPSAHLNILTIRDGRVLDGPAVHPQPCLRVRIRNGQIEIGKVVTPSEIPLAPSAAVEESPVR